jgi:hypothetical protein
MNSALITALKDLDAANEILNEVILHQEPDQSLIDPELTQAVKKNLPNPNWQLITSNYLEGTFFDQPLKLNMDIDFSFNTTNLFVKIDRQPMANSDVFNQAVGNLKKQPHGEALADILISSLMPHAYGLSRQVIIKEALPPPNRVGLIEGVIELAVLNNLIRLNYAPLLSVFLPEALNLDQSLFKQKVWINPEFLTDRQPFKKHVSFEDNQPGQTLFLTIDLDFKPI